MSYFDSIAGAKGGKSGGGGNDSPNTLRSKSIGRILDLVSEGPILGLVNGQKGVYLNETPWMADNGQLNFTGVQCDARYGYATQDPITGFPNVEREVSVGTQIKKLIPVTRTVSDPLLNAVRVAISVPGLVYTDDDGNMNGTSVNIIIEVRPYGGSYVTMVNDTISGKTTSAYERSYRIPLPAGGAPWDIRISRINDDSADIKLQNDTYWSRYTEIIDHSLIYPDSAYFGTVFDASLFKDGIPQRQYLIDGIKMNIPSNYYPFGMTTENIATYSEDLSNAAYTKVAVNLTAQIVAPDGNSTAYGIAATTTSAAAYSHRLDSTVSGLTPSLEANHSVYIKPGAAFSGSYIRFQLNEGAYYAAVDFNPTTHTVALTTSLSAGGSISSYGVVDVGGGWYRIWIAGLVSPSRVSSNYAIVSWGTGNTYGTYAGDGVTPFAYVWGFHTSRNKSLMPYIKTMSAIGAGLTPARYYDATWDGTFKTDWTNNPAWVFYMLMTNKRFGLGQWITSSQIDKWQLYTLAKYCDELVPDGFGGLEPRFTFNGVIKDKQDAYKVIQNIATAFRGIVYWGAGSTLISYDSPKDPVILVTPANVENGQFDYQGVGWKARHSAALVRWNDPNNLYKENIEAVEDQDLIDRFGWRPIETTAPGCTSRGQAYRWGKWILDTEKNETETVTYRASFDHMIKNGSAVMPGDIIKILDPSYAGVRNGGRVKQVFNLGDADTIGSGTATEPRAYLDAPVTLSNAESYTLSMVLPDGTILERAVINEATSTSQNFTALKLSGGALPSVPLANSMWILTSTSVSPRLFRVLFVKETAENIVEVQALYYDPTKFARVEQDIVLETPNFSVVKVGPLNLPRNMTYKESLYRNVSGTVGAMVTVSWEAPTSEPRVNFYEVHLKEPGQDWKYYTTVREQSVDIRSVTDAVYGFRVRAISVIGTPSNWLTMDGVHLFGTNIKPANVANFNMNAVSDQAYLTWDVMNDMTVDYYIIKQQNVITGAQWGSGIPLIARLSKDTGHTFVPLLFGTYMIKAVSIAGIESDAATMVVSNIASILNFNVIQNVVADPTFTGTYTNCSVVSGKLVASADTAPGTYKQDCTCELSGYVDLGAVYTNRLIQNLSASGSRPSYTMNSWAHLSDVNALSGVVSSDWSVWVEYATTNDNPAGTPTWSGWTKLVVGDSTARAYKFRIRMQTTDPTIQNSVLNLTITVDMPDRVEGQQNVSIAAAGTAITYANGFKVKPAVAVTIQGATAGDDIILTSETTAGCTIQVKNSGVGVARTVNWIAKGYGRS